MEKEVWRGGNMLYPLPVVMVSCADASGERDIVTVAWTGTVCTNPPMLYVSLRPERHSYHIVHESGEFVVNLVSSRLQRACDWCGARSGRDHDKFEECGLHAADASSLELAPVIEESPVNLECRVTDVLELGSHHMFLAEVKAVQVDASLLDERGRLDLSRANLTAYSHGEYRELGRRIGTFGYAVRKPRSGQGGRAGATCGERTKPGSGERRAQGGARKPGGRAGQAPRGGRGRGPRPGGGGRRR